MCSVGTGSSQLALYKGLQQLFVSLYSLNSELNHKTQESQSLKLAVSLKDDLSVVVHSVLSSIFLGGSSQFYLKPV